MYLFFTKSLISPNSAKKPVQKYHNIIIIIANFCTGGKKISKGGNIFKDNIHYTPMYYILQYENFINLLLPGERIILLIVMKRHWILKDIFGSVKLSMEKEREGAPLN